MTQSDDSVKLSISPSGVATLLMNRPEQRNNFNPAAMETLVRHIEQLGRNPDVRVIVLQAGHARWPRSWGVWLWAMLTATCAWT